MWYYTGFVFVFGIAFSVYIMAKYSRRMEAEVSKKERVVFFAFLTSAMVAASFVFKELYKVL